MASNPINIAEFRGQSYSPSSGRTASPAEPQNRGLYVVANPARVEEAVEDAPATRPGVYDFAAAQEKHRERVQNLYDPTPFRRRRAANLVRLDEPRVAVLCVAPKVQAVSVNPGDDCDLPPAA